MVDRTTLKYRTIGKTAAQRHRNWRRLWLFEYKCGMSCVYCGNDNPLCLDFDHVDRSTKDNLISKMVTSGIAWHKVLEELAKCQPVCRNCHNIKSLLESQKMKGCEIEQYIPEPLKFLLHSPKEHSEDGC